jgi:putative transposase
MSLQPYFTPANTSPSYELRFHFCWYAYSRQHLFSDLQTRQLLDRSFLETAKRYQYHVLEHEFESAAMRAVLSLRPEMSPSSVTKAIKGNLATQARKQLGIADLWSRGWFVRSNGHVTNETVRNYVASQYEHHNATPISQPERAELAKWHGAADPAEIRTSAHGALEYNLHVVFVTRRRYEFLDLEVAERLVHYFRHVCEKKEWIVYEINVVWNHVHLFLGLNPADAPGAVALSLMNNSAYMLQQRYGGAIRHEKMSGIWQPSYYAGTVGSATTAQIKAFLQRMGSG